MYKLKINFTKNLQELRTDLKKLVGEFSSPIELIVRSKDDSVKVIIEFGNLRNKIYCEALNNNEKTSFTEDEIDTMVQWALINLVGKLEQEKKFKVRGLKSICGDEYIKPKVKKEKVYINIENTYYELRDASEILYIDGKITQIGDVVLIKRKAEIFKTISGIFIPVYYIKTKKNNTFLIDFSKKRAWPYTLKQ